ncbi:MAG TPA: glutaminyl-peptide cyclotransferase [Acidobacteriaceae bacterium]|nr:glutaminyl-peptide cyclotransferase [Acidobacteriaceae bacterium]
MVLSFGRTGCLLGFAIAAVFVCASCLGAPVSSFRVVATYPHSTTSFTEGLFYLNGLLYESTGLEGHSALLVVQPKTGRILQRRNLLRQYFGEGIAAWGPYIYQLTWQAHICFVYNRFDLHLVKQFAYDGEGWGMTSTATEIITSDGSATLRFRDPNTFKETRHVVAMDGTRQIDQLNELEYVDGEILANIWHSDRIVRISPRDGHVIGWIDLTGLLPDAQRVNGEAVLNGIAYDARQKRLFVTGKQWPAIFEIKPVSHSTHVPSVK